ncbi:MAG: hypothetical protein ACK47U_10485, partial [Verrucomicrobiota bacterium]
MKTFALLLLCWLAPLVAAEGPSAAEQAYARGDYAGAVELWSTEVRAEGVTAARLASLGNAEWRLGR